MPLYFAYGFTRCYCDELIDGTAQVANRKIVSNNPCVRCIRRRSMGSRILMFCKSRLFRFWPFHKQGPFHPIRPLQSKRFCSDGACTLMLLCNRFSSKLG